MRFAAALFVLLFPGLCVPTITFAQDAADSTQSKKQAQAKAAAKDPDHVLLHVLQSTPVRDVAESLAQLFRSEKELQIIPDVTNNALLVRGPRNQVSAVVEALKKLDQPPKLITLEISLVEVLGDAKIAPDRLNGPLHEVQSALEELQAQNAVLVTDSIQITTLDNQPAKVQIGRQVPTITSTQVTSRGRTHSTEYLSVGTLVSLTPRVNRNHVVLELDLEKSDVRPAPPTDDETPLPPEMITVTLQTTVAVEDGHALLMEAARTRSHDKTTTNACLVLGVDIKAVGEKPAPPPQTSKPIRKAKPTAGAASEKEPVAQTDDRIMDYSRAMLQRYDRNRDGRLEKNEWSAMRSDASAADSNSDGHITVEELAQWMTQRSRTLRPAPSPPAADDSRYAKYAKSLIARYDTDNDQMLDAKEREASSWLQSAAKGDADGNGKLDEAELVDWMQKRS
jgi:Ca2+-binding EF-hand superfamily protein